MSRHLRWIIPTVFYALLIGFIVYYLTTIDYELLATVELDWRWIALATLLGMAARYWMVLIWLTILRGLGAPPFRRVAPLAAVYAKAWLGRYIPGTAPWILGKIYFASQHGLSKSKLAVSSLLEGGLQAIVMMTVGLLLVLVDPRAQLVDPLLLTLLVIAVVVGIVVLLPPIFNRLLLWVARILRRRVLSEEDLPGYRVIGTGTLMFVINAALTGVATFFVAKAVDPSLGLAEIVFVSAAVNLSAAVSMVAFFAPGGLGVREALIVLLLSIVMPAEYAIVVAVVVRLWSIGLDLAFFGIAWLAERVTRRDDPTVPATEEG